MSSEWDLIREGYAAGHCIHKLLVGGGLVSELLKVNRVCFREGCSDASCKQIMSGL